MTGEQIFKYLIGSLLWQITNRKEYLRDIFVHIVSWLPEFHLDFPPRIYKPVLALHTLNLIISQLCVFVGTLIV